jgi:hypothetical protein
MRFRSVFFVLTPSSLRRVPRPPDRLFRRRPLRLLPRLALFGAGHRRLPTDQKCLGRGPSEFIRRILNGTLCAARQRRGAIGCSTAIIAIGAVTLFSSFRSSDLSQSI